MKQKFNQNNNKYIQFIVSNNINKLAHNANETSMVGFINQYLLLKFPTLALHEATI